METSYKQKLQETLAKPVGANKHKNKSKPTSPPAQMIVPNKVPDPASKIFLNLYSPLGLSPYDTVEQHIMMTQSIESTSPMQQDTGFHKNPEAMHQYSQPIPGNQMMAQNMNYPQQMYNHMTRQPHMGQGMANQPGMHGFQIQHNNMQQMAMGTNMHPGMQGAPMQPGMQPNVQNVMQGMHQMHPGMMQNVPQNMQNPITGMQQNIHPGIQQHHGGQGHNFGVDNYINHINTNQRNSVQDKGFNKRQDQQKSNPSSVPVFTVDISTELKLNKFKEDRRQKIVERLAPYLPNQRQREDLEWSITEIKKTYEGKIKDLEDKQHEVCQEYFKTHHKVTLPQIKEIFKYVQKTIETNKGEPFDTNLEMQQKSLDVINDIIVNNHVVDDPADVIAEVPEGYKEELVDHPMVVRRDLEAFLREVAEKKFSMKQARQNIINKVRSVIGEMPNIDNVEIYGSYQTNLDLPWSDIDFVIFSHASDSSECLDLLNIRFTEEKTTESWIKKIEYIGTASVPIIKMVTEDGEFEVKVDLTFGDDTHKGSDCVQLGK